MKVIVLKILSMFVVLSCGLVSADSPEDFSEYFLNKYYEEKNILGFIDVLHPDLLESLESNQKDAVALRRIERDILSKWDVKEIKYNKSYTIDDMYCVEFEIFGENYGDDFKRKSIVYLKDFEGDWKVYAIQ